MGKVGRPLTQEELQIFKPYFAQLVLDEARIIEGKVPFWLRRDMCAVVLGTRIYIRSGYYLPNTKIGTALLGHELTHVSQHLFGMTWFKYLWSCRLGYRKSNYEIDAYAKGNMIGSNFDELRA